MLKQRHLVVASFSEDNWNAASSVHINYLINDTVLLLLEMDRPEMRARLASASGLFGSCT